MSRRQWARFTALASQPKLTALVNSLSLSAPGQMLLIGVLPMAVASQLFPGRFQARALEVVPRIRLPALHAPATPWHLRLSPPPAVAHAVKELRIAVRGLYLALLFSPAILLCPLAMWAGGAARAAWMQLICWCLERAGPAFIKWGQWSSTRPDLFPPDLCSAMERLQSSAPAHSAAYSRAAIARTLPAPAHALFESFEDAPVASGSIAQIHRARLSAAGAALMHGKHRAGEVVAVKVRHPGVTTVMEHDFVLMDRAARALSMLPGLAALRLDESVRQFGGPLKEQLDLKVEAAHLARFKHNFRLWPNVAFPTPLFPLVSSDVLVESFERGDLISHFVNQPTYAHRSMLAETGLACYLQMLLRDNFIHADLHPGNILVREAEPAGPSSGWLGWLSARLRRAAGAAPPKLVLLDTGMIAELSKADQGHLIAFFKALTTQDGESLGHAILGMSEAAACKDPAAFVDRLKSMFDALDPEFISQHTSNVIGSVIDTIREHQVTLRSAVSTVVVTTLVLEGWSSKLDPDMRILDTLRDMLVADWRERIGRTVDSVMRSGTLAVL